MDNQPDNLGQNPAMDLPLSVAHGASYRDGLAELHQIDPVWCERLKCSDLVLAIPLPACENKLPLSRCLGGSVAMEVKYAEICWNNGWIGFQHSKPVEFAPLRNVPFRATSQLAQLCKNYFKMDLPKSIFQGQTSEDLVDIQQRLLGIVGFLWTEPQFSKEVTQLRQQLKSLEGKSIFTLPFNRTKQMGNFQLSQDSEMKRLISSSASMFLDSVNTFMDHWSLERLTSWDYPLPQGPDFVDVQSAGSILRPEFAVSMTIPANYPLTRDQSLSEVVLQQQKQVGMEQGLPEALIHMSHHERYAQMARYIHLERVLRSRMSEKLPRGFVAMTSALATDYLGVSEESVRQYRRWINKCHKGQKQEIEALN